jgi:hypothetical protein
MYDCPSGDTRLQYGEQGKGREGGKGKRADTDRRGMQLDRAYAVAAKPAECRREDTIASASKSMKPQNFADTASKRCRIRDTVAESMGRAEHTVQVDCFAGIL